MILVTADTHGENDFHKLSNDKIKRVCDGQMPQYLIICGDFAVPWFNAEDNPQDIYLRKWYDEKPYQVIVCKGNHENYSRIERMPLEEYMGGLVRRYSKNIVYVENNSILTIEGKTYYFFGGANSIDKACRVPFLSWWPQETASPKECLEMMQKVSENPKVDYIISHTCPESLVKIFSNDFDKLYDPDPTRVALDYLKDHIQFEKWFFGHFHKDVTEEKYTCSFKKVHQIV